MGLKQLFKVREGKHAVRLPSGKLKTYTKGQVVASVDDLSETFPEKFDKVHEENVDVTRSGVERALKNREEFERKNKQPDPESEESGQEEVDEEEQAEEETVAEAERAEVTEKFPILKKLKLRVFYDGDNFYVEKDGKSLAAGLSDQTAVLKWFKKWNAERKK